MRLSYSILSYSFLFCLPVVQLPQSLWQQIPSCNLYKNASFSLFSLHIRPTLAYREPDSTSQEFTNTGSDLRVLKRTDLSLRFGERERERCLIPIVQVPEIENETSLSSILRYLSWTKQKGQKLKVYNSQAVRTRVHTSISREAQALAQAFQRGTQCLSVPSCGTTMNCAYLT